MNENLPLRLPTARIGSKSVDSGTENVEMSKTVLNDRLHCYDSLIHIPFKPAKSKFLHTYLQHRRGKKRSTSSQEETLLIQ
eukprot:scaffold4123_cov145-Skeletonema_menzelii.AAC.11